MATPSLNCFVIGPEANIPHLHTIIMLHGKGTTGHLFANELFSTQMTKILDRPTSLDGQFNFIRWVFPDAPFPDDTEGPGTKMWFNMTSRARPDDDSETQQPGLQESIDRVLAVIDFEADLVPRKNIFLGGFDQGMGVALATFLVDGNADFSGFIGLSG